MAVDSGSYVDKVFVTQELDYKNRPTGMFYTTPVKSDVNVASEPYHSSPGQLPNFGGKSAGCEDCWKKAAIALGLIVLYFALKRGK